MYVWVDHIGRFSARDVKVVKTNLMSETLKPSGIKTGRKNEKGWVFFFRRHHTRDLHHTSIEFFLESFKNINELSELSRVSKSEFYFDHLQESLPRDAFEFFSAALLIEV